MSFAAYGVKSAGSLTEARGMYIRRSALVRSRATARSPRAIRLLLALVILAAVTAGCGGSASFDPVVDETGGVLQLEAQGDDDRHELSYVLEVGQQVGFVMTMDFDISQSMQGSSFEVDSPTVEMYGDAEVTGISLAGNYEIHYTYDDVRVHDDGDPLLRDDYRTLMGQVIGLESTVVMSPTGVVLESSADTSGIADEAIRSSMDQTVDQLGELAAPLPAQAVGVGASWTYTSQLTVDGVESSAEARFTVVEIDESRVVLAFEVADLTEQQTLQIPGAPAGATFELVGSEGGGSGQTNIDLRSPVPSAGSTTSEIRQEMRISDATGDVTLEQTLSIEMTFAAE